MFNAILSKIRKYKRERYLSDLIRRGIKIGKNTHLMDGVFLDPPHCFLISIGNDCTLAPNVRIVAHDASTYKFLGITKIGKVNIYDYCFIGDSAIILPGVSIGPNAIVGAGSVVTRDVPPNSVVAGSPAKVIGSFDEFMKRHTKKKEVCRCFPESRFHQGPISDKDKEEMVTYLQSEIGYLIRD